MFWVVSVYFNTRNTLPKSGTFLLGHPVCAVVGIIIKRNHYCTSTAMLSSFALLTSISRFTIQWECNVAFTCLQSLHEGIMLHFISIVHISKKQPPQNSWSQKYNMKQVPHSGPTNQMPLYKVWLP